MRRFLSRSPRRFNSVFFFSCLPFLLLTDLAPHPPSHYNNGGPEGLLSPHAPMGRRLGGIHIKVVVELGDKKVQVRARFFTFTDVALRNVTSASNVPRIAQEADPPEDNATITAARQEEKYTSSQKHQGRPTSSSLQRQ